MTSTESSKRPSLALVRVGVPDTCWVVFIVAGASRQDGSQILEYVYPNHTMLYLGLAMGLPIVVGMWLMGLRKADTDKINRSVSYLRGTSILVVLMQLGHTVYLVSLQHWQFTWTNAMTLVLLCWFAIYLVNSRYVIDCLAMPRKINTVTDQGHTTSN